MIDSISKTESPTFNELDIKVGQVIQIYPNPSDAANSHECLFVGCLPGEALLISVDPKTGLFPKVTEGQNVILRILSANGIALLATTVLFLSDVPTFIAYLDFPQDIKFHLLRRATRVDVQVPVLVSCISDKTKSNVPGRILDISIGGSRVELDADVGGLGETVQIRGKFRVGDIQRVVGIKSTLVRKKASSNGKIMYGMEFQEDSEDALLILFGFIFSSMAFGRVQTVS